ncbi:PAS domain-containing protein [Phenylobacterium sp.]|uniref:sensor histidine kinase n=1 Tax=Phenylobacterium sp. TaxID=1871053 RepID=UPI00286C4507|nr:PAS domain-containing protein [Phenylobacterium sp.]
MRPSADATALGMAFVSESRPDGSRRFIFAGPRCLGVNGVEGEAVMRDAALLYDMILPGHRAAFAAAEADALANMRPFDIEVAMRRPDGEVRWHRFASLPRPQPDGSVLWDGLQIDVTDRRRMAAELIEQRRRLEVAADATGLGFWEWDVEADRVVWSDRNKHLHGLPADAEVTVESYVALVHPDDVAVVRNAFEAARDRPSGGDYSIEHRIVAPDGETRWLSSHARVSNAADGQARLVVGTTLDITERRAAEERRVLVLGELAHRARNFMAVIMAIVGQSARGQPTVESFRQVLTARLQAMATSQDLVTAAGGQPVVLAEVIARSVTVFGLGRFDLDGALAEVTVRGDMAVGMGLLLHELGTNAVKYGALSNDTGRVAVALKPADAGRAAFEWREAGGPAVTPSTRQGFGTRLLQQALRNQGGKVTFDFSPRGFSARVDFPVAP